MWCYVDYYSYSQIVDVDPIRLAESGGISSSAGSTSSPLRALSARRHDCMTLDVRPLSPKHDWGDSTKCAVNGAYVHAERPCSISNCLGPPLGLRMGTRITTLSKQGDQRMIPERASNIGSSCICKREQNAGGTCSSIEFHGHGWRLDMIVACARWKREADIMSRVTEGEQCPQALSSVRVRCARR